MKPRRLASASALVALWMCSFCASAARTDVHLQERYARPINPYVEGPAPLEEHTCTRRNGCLDAIAAINRFRDSVPIAKQIGLGNMLGIQREQGYPPDGINGPVNRLLTDIPPPPGVRVTPPEGAMQSLSSGDEGPEPPPEFLPSPAV